MLLDIKLCVIGLYSAITQTVAAFRKRNNFKELGDCIHLEAEAGESWGKFF